METEAEAGVPQTLPPPRSMLAPFSLPNGELGLLGISSFEGDELDLFADFSWFNLARIPGDTGRAGEVGASPGCSAMDSSGGGLLLALASSEEWPPTCSLSWPATLESGDEGWKTAAGAVLHAMKHIYFPHHQHHITLRIILRILVFSNSIYNTIMGLYISGSTTRGC